MTGLAEIVSALDRAGLLVRAPAAFPPLEGLTEDSRQVRPGWLFCAVVGSSADGHRFLADAVRRGAAAALVAQPTELSIPTVTVRDSRRAAAVAAATWYGRPGEQLEVIGVTGTNGKSTTVALIRHLLNDRETVGTIGTLGAFDGQGQPVQRASDLTTPGAVEFQALLATLRSRGVRTVVTEASSHALDQQRLYGLPLAAAVYTNLTRDHLDYHRDLASYLAAKLQLSSLLRPGGLEVVNADDPAWEALERRPDRVRRAYGIRQPAEVRAAAIELAAAGSRFMLWLGAECHRASLPLVGEFNVSNALAAVATAWGLGRRPAELVERLATAPQVPGRMEQLVSGPFVVLRDYAHTPDALERAIRSLRPLTRGRLLVVFGCGGDRDRGKRPVMGRIAAQLADLAVVTSDNPRTEDPERIIDEIEAGMEGVPHLRITDRREAVRRAVELLRPGDCLLLAGKGHETYQIVGQNRLPLDERELVEEAMAERASRHGSSHRDGASGAGR